MSDLTTALLNEQEERFRSPYQHVEEIVRKVGPFVKARRLARLPKPGAWQRRAPDRVATDPLTGKR